MRTHSIERDVLATAGWVVDLLNSDLGELPVDTDVARVWRRPPI